MADNFRIVFNRVDRRIVGVIGGRRISVGCTVAADIPVIRRCRISCRFKLKVIICGAAAYRNCNVMTAEYVIVQNDFAVGVNDNAFNRGAVRRQFAFNVVGKSFERDDWLVAFVGRIDNALFVFADRVTFCNGARHDSGCAVVGVGADCPSLVGNIGEVDAA